MGDVNELKTRLADGFFFTEGPVRDFAGAKRADHERYARFFHHVLDRWVLLPPSGYELWSLGTEHGPAEIDRVLEAAARSSELAGADPLFRTVCIEKNTYTHTAEWNQ